MTFTAPIGAGHDYLDVSLNDVTSQNTTDLRHRIPRRRTTNAGGSQAPMPTHGDGVLTQPSPNGLVCGGGMMLPGDFRCEDPRPRPQRFLGHDEGDDVQSTHDWFPYASHSADRDNDKAPERRANKKLASRRDKDTASKRHEPLKEGQGESESHVSVFSRMRVSATERLHGRRNAFMQDGVGKIRMPCEEQCDRHREVHPERPNSQIRQPIQHPILRAPQGAPDAVDGGAGRSGDERLEFLLQRLDALEKRSGPGHVTEPMFRLRSPFSERILRATLPNSFQMPPIPRYDGTADPQEHFNRYQTLMNVVTFSKERFLVHFAGNRKKKLHFSHLLSVRQRPDEPLREFLARWKLETTRVYGADDKTRLSTFHMVLRSGDSLKRLALEKPREYVIALAMVEDEAEAEELEENKKKEEAGRLGTTVAAARPPARKVTIDERSHLPAGLCFRKGRDQRDRRSFGKDVYKEGVDDRKPYPPRGPKLIFLDELTPLTHPVSAILDFAEHQGLVEYDPRFPPICTVGDGPYCRLHKAAGHDTDACKVLKREIENLIQAGYLRQFIKKKNTWRKDDGKKNVDNRGKNPAGTQQKKRKEIGLPSDEEEEANPRQKRVEENRMIYGGNTGGDSAEQRKKLVHSAYVGDLCSAPGPSKVTKTEPLLFGPKDLPEIPSPHREALVVKCEINEVVIHRSYIDNGSSVNIMYVKTFDELGLKKELLRRVRTPLSGFTGDIIDSEGLIEVMVTFGDGEHKRTIPVEFMVFPTVSGVGVCRGNQRIARLCYQKQTKKMDAQDLRVDSIATTLLKEEEGRPRAEPAEETEDVVIMEDQQEKKIKLDINIGAELRSKIIQVLKENFVVFAWSVEDMPGVSKSLITHRLAVGPDAEPVKQRRRHLSKDQRDFMKKEVDMLQAAGHVKEIKYPTWLANVVLTPKGQTFRMCVDYTDLNRACPMDPFPLPNIDQMIDETVGCEVMSFVDAFRGYHQVFMHEEDAEKTVFLTLEGVYCYLVMEFGLKNSGATYTRMVSRVFHSVLGKTMAAYVDDMIAKSKPTSDHAEDLKKCTFGVEGDTQRPIYYVSRTLRDAELRYSVVEKTVLAFANTIKKLNHYFQAHEVEVRSHQPLSIIFQNLTASNRVIKRSVYLSQYQIEMKPRTAIKAQALADFMFKVSNNEAEYEALLSGLRIILNLKAEYVTIRCDSRLVVSQIKGEFDTKEEWMRLYKEAALELLKTLKGYELAQIPRAENTEADVLSKLSNDSPEHISMMAHIEDLGSPSIHVQLISVITGETDGWITELIRYKKDGILPSGETAARLIKRRAPTYVIDSCSFSEYDVNDKNEMDLSVIENGRLYKRSYNGTLLRCVDEARAEEIMEKVHEGVCAAHQGPFSMARRIILQGYFWPTMVKDYAIRAKRCKITTDNGNQFQDGDFNELLQGWKIRHTYSSVAYPQGNGLVENANWTIMDGIKKRLESYKGAWVDQLPNVLWAYRTTPRRATGETPFSMCYGLEARAPSEVFVPTWREENYEARENEETMTADFHFVEERRERAFLRAENYRRQVKVYYDRKVRAREFRVGDLVHRKREASQPTKGGKFAKSYEGPYKVTAVLRPGTYKLSTLEGRELGRHWNTHNLISFYM
ncbi:unnamed protein product [Cuscuta campestris]|uniref:RNA-directed DNA polymerase n=1 Tax=Cuscuta campestris TaxID=132261 RepID=A0A484MMK4_9ASTE|nr:unnamed protein product [Cuscuta campestris]